MTLLSDIWQKLILISFLISFLFVVLIIQDFSTNPAYVTRTSLLFEELNPDLKTGKMEKIVFNGPRIKKRVALTFDADMTIQMKQDLETGIVKSYYDNELINILNRTGTKATLFLSGMWIESYKNEAFNLSSNSLFELGNHTYSHLAFESSCYGLALAHNDQKNDELIKTQTLLREINGFDNKLFRFPGGCYSDFDLDIVSKTGQVAIQWDVAAQDGFNTDASNIISNVVDNVKNGSIIVMHMNGYPNEPRTAEALPYIITSLKNKGFEFVTVSELLDIARSEAVIVPHLSKIIAKNI